MAVPINSNLLVLSTGWIPVEIIMFNTISFYVIRKLCYKPTFPCDIGRDFTPQKHPAIANLTVCLDFSEVNRSGYLIHSGCFYSASSSPPLLWGVPDYSIDAVDGVNKPNLYRQLRVKDFPKVPSWRPECDSNLRPSGRKASNLPLSQHAML